MATRVGNAFETMLCFFDQGLPVISRGLIEVDFDDSFLRSVQVRENPEPISVISNEVVVGVESGD